MIGFVTDSASQIPAPLAADLGVIVVPVIVTLDGVDHREGVDLTAEDFWARLDGPELPAVSTSQPSPGAFLDAYGDAVAAGATEIVSVHVGADVSGTVNAARLAADETSVPVHVVDSGTASFGVTACLWRAADALTAGASAPEELVRLILERLEELGASEAVEVAGEPEQVVFQMPRELDSYR